MADEIDTTNDRLMNETARALQAVQDSAARIPKGEPGECVGCGEYSLRLVEGVCAPCRDLVADVQRRFGR